MRRHLSDRIRLVVVSSLLAMTVLSMAASAVLADGGGSNIPH